MQELEELKKIEEAHRLLNGRLQEELTRKEAQLLTCKEVHLRKCREENDKLKEKIEALREEALSLRGELSDTNHHLTIMQQREELLLARVKAYKSITYK